MTFFSRLVVLAMVGTVAAVATADCPLPDPTDCIYVDGDDPGCLPLGSGGNGTESVPFCSIQDGYDHAVALGTSPTDIKTVLVLPATYNECVVAAGDNPPCDCCTKDSTGGTGCDCPTCETDVCAIEPFCCEVVWDGFCDFVATDLCSCCDGLNPGTCTDDIEDRPVHGKHADAGPDGHGHRRARRGFRGDQGRRRGCQHAGQRDALQSAGLRERG